MNLFRYLDALDRIAEAQRGPKGLLDDEWFDTYANRTGSVPQAGQGTTTPFAATPGPDPFNEWYRAQLRQALNATFARLRGQSMAMPPLGLAATPGLPVAPADRTSIAEVPESELPDGNPSPYAPRPVPLPKGQSNRPDIQLLSVNGEPASDDERRDYGYPWYEPDASNTGLVESSNVPPVPELLRPDPRLKSRPSVEKPFRQLPNPSVDERDLARAELKHREIVEMWRESGRHTSADHLEHFLDGDGSTLVIERDEARRFRPFREAEQKNEWRQERSFLLGGKAAHAEKLANLKDGETIEFEDNFKVDYGPGSFAQQAIDPRTTDFATAFGRVGLKSEGDFKATRRGDTIEIEGVVRHGLDDRYDFNPGQPYSSEPNLLERKGNARSYDRTSSWKRRLSGTIKLDNGRLYSPRFAWEDIDP